METYTIAADATAAATLATNTVEAAVTTVAARLAANPQEQRTHHAVCTLSEKRGNPKSVEV
jgi:hypothetical protein